MNFEYYFDKLLSFYNVSTLKDLSEATNIPISTMSSIKQRNSVTALKKKCRELSIYNDIFGDLKLSTNEEESNQELNNDVFSDDILKTLDIIRTMVKNNQDLDNKLNETLKSFIKENL